MHYVLNLIGCCNNSYLSNVNKISYKNSKIYHEISIGKAHQSTNTNDLLMHTTAFVVSSG